MDFFKSFIVLIAIAIVSACGSGDKQAAPAAATATPAAPTEWDNDTPADGKLLFKATVKKGPESAKIILASSDSLFVNAMMGTITPDITQELKLTAKIRIFNLDYIEDGNQIAEIDCPESGAILDFGPQQYSDLPNKIALSVGGLDDNNRPTVTFECKGSDGVRSFYVTIFQDHDPTVDNGYELKFDFEQRSFIGRIYIKDKSEPSTVYGKTLLF